jgi:hypothetical protein
VNSLRNPRALVRAWYLSARRDARRRRHLGADPIAPVFGCFTMGPLRNVAVSAEGEVRCWSAGIRIWRLGEVHDPNPEPYEIPLVRLYRQFRAPPARGTALEAYRLARQCVRRPP